METIQQFRHQQPIPGTPVQWSDGVSTLTASLTPRDHSHGLGVWPILEVCNWINPQTADLPAPRDVMGELSAFVATFLSPALWPVTRLETWLSRAETQHPADYSRLDYGEPRLLPPSFPWAIRVLPPSVSPGTYQTLTPRAKTSSKSMQSIQRGARIWLSWNTSSVMKTIHGAPSHPAWPTLCRQLSPQHAP